MSGRVDKDLRKIQQRVEAWVQPMAEHEVQSVDVDTRTHLAPRSARALVIAIAAVVLALGVWMGLRVMTADTHGADLPYGQNMSDLGGGGGTGSKKAESTASKPAGNEPNSAGGASDAPVEPQIVVVSVQGLVQKTGLYRLHPDTRVGEAIEAAGGALPTANLGAINLAEKISDGLQIMVTPEGSITALPGQADALKPNAGDSNAATGGQTGEKTGGEGAVVNLNTATAAQLENLPGVGPATAKAIVAWREANGNFATVEQLMEVRGIGPAKFAALQDAIRV